MLPECLHVHRYNYDGATLLRLSRALPWGCPWPELPPLLAPWMARKVGAWRTLEEGSKQPEMSA